MQIPASGRRPSKKAGLIATTRARSNALERSSTIVTGKLFATLVPVLLLVLKTTGVVATATAALLIFHYSFKDLQDLSLLVYLAGVVLVSVRLGPWPAVLAAILSAAAQAFFFYPPDFSFEIEDPHKLINLMVFLLVALCTGNLAVRLRRELLFTQARETEIRGLYEFSRQLACGFTVEDLITAVQGYLSDTLGRLTILVPPPGSSGLFWAEGTGLPDEVHKEAVAMLAPGGREQRTIADFETGRLWLLWAVSSQAAIYGVIAVDLGKSSIAEAAATKIQADNVLAETNAMLKRLDLEAALTAATSRAKTEEFRAALIGTVSHELRSPLAAILGSASVLDRVPAVRQNEQVLSLVEAVLEEAKRLDQDIQKVLDATRIAARNLQTQAKAVSVFDLIEQSIACKRAQLERHELQVDVPGNLPLVLVDPILIEQALVQLLENAAKYSVSGSVIKVAARLEQQNIRISVTDQGSGLTENEKSLVGRRSFRGNQIRDFVPGSGLGLWIAHCFVAANGGVLEAETQGRGLGATISVRLRTVAHR
jgi:K+-sensing histidine kinase KdpD